MRILITGNMGYIGPVLTRHLRRVLPNAHLVGYDSAYFAQNLTSEIFPEQSLNAQLFGDIRDIVKEDLVGFDAIVHLAAISNDPMGNKFEAVTKAINQDASVSVALAAVQAGVRNFVFASSCSVYGFAADGTARRENDALNPLTAYARSKIGTEHALAQADLGRMVVSCLRFATACGASPRLRLDLVLNDFVACALSSNEITVLSDGTPWRPLINVADMARAIEWAVFREQDNGGQMLSCNVGADSWNYQVKDLAAAVATSIPGTKVLLNKNAPPDRRSYKVDFSLYRRLAPGHQPIETLESTVAGLHSSLSKMGFADENFRDSTLIRLKVIERLQATGQISTDLRWVLK